MQPGCEVSIAYWPAISKGLWIVTRIQRRLSMVTKWPRHLLTAPSAMALVANALGYTVLTPGMHRPQVVHARDIFQLFGLPALRADRQPVIGDADPSVHRPKPKTTMMGRVRDKLSTAWNVASRHLPALCSGRNERASGVRTVTDRSRPAIALLPALPSIMTVGSCATVTSSSARAPYSKASWPSTVAADAHRCLSRATLDATDRQPSIAKMISTEHMRALLPDFFAGIIDPRHCQGRRHSLPRVHAWGVHKAPDSDFSNFRTARRDDLAVGFRVHRISGYASAFARREHVKTEVDDDERL